MWFSLFTEVRPGVLVPPAGVNMIHLFQRKNNCLPPERDFYFAFRGRIDDRQDNARAISGKRFLYIRNYMPWTQKVTCRWNMNALLVGR